MYYALNQDVNNMEAYHGFIIDILKSNNEYYITIFKQIIQQAQELTKSHDFYSIDSNRFGIINFLAQHEEIINNIDTNNLKKEDFEKLLDCFEYNCHC